MPASLDWTSQTKPGPNMALAVAMNSSRSESTDEKSAFMAAVRSGEGRDSTFGSVFYSDSATC